MNICIDGLGITHLKETSIGIYSYELLNNLMDMYPQPTYHILWDKEKEKLNVGKNNKISFMDLDIDRRNNDYSNIEKYITNNKISVYHCPNNGFSIPKNKVCHYVTTIHDLLPLVNSSYVDKKYINKFDNILPYAIENSDKIIAVSEYIKEQLRDYFDVPEKKIEVIYPGCSSMFVYKNDDECKNILKNKYNIDDDYILHVGSIHIRKNLDKLIRAFKYINGSNPKLKLVIVGKNDGKRKEYYSQLINLVKELEIDNSVIFTGTVDYNDMPYFYSKAKCVLNLSKYEGFPISTIEAIACDVPVICNKHRIFKEVINDVGVLVDANDNYDLVREIQEVLYNNDYKERILKKQREKVQNYKWDKAIVKTVRVYESFL